MNPVPSGKAMPTISMGLLWHSLSSGNLGVGALTESQLALMCQAAEEASVRCRFIVSRDGE